MWWLGWSGLSGENVWLPKKLQVKKKIEKRRENMFG